jgi:hypothetical protein
MNRPWNGDPARSSGAAATAAVALALSALVLGGLAAMAASAAAEASPKRTPQPSPFASVTQRIGLNDVTIAYHRPGVKGRKIWGELVPWGQVWRAGANDATTIAFTDDVTIEGQGLPAGTYGFFAVPGDKEWVLVFNRDARQWGAFSYKETQDALRVKVKARSAPFEEWLSYRFRDLTLNSAVAVLAWEKVEVPFLVRNKTEVKAK